MLTGSNAIMGGVLAPVSDDVLEEEEKAIKTRKKKRAAMLLEKAIRRNDFDICNLRDKWSDGTVTSSTDRPV